MPITPCARLVLVLFLLVGTVPKDQFARADWPTFRHDYARSGRAGDAVDAEQLGRAWVHRTGTTPQTAWSGAAKYDAYGHVPDLKSMRNYDPVFHPVVAGGRLYFGSSVDHAMHCLDLATGKELWSYTTEGAVRIAPTIVDGRAFFGSDDGYAYCVSANDGKLLWRFSPKEPAAHVIHEGNLISQWPCRTGVVVDQGIAYTSFSLFPWQRSYLVALDAKTGKVTSKKHYVREYPALTLEGPMLASAAQLVSPQGRVAPLLFRRSDGDALGSLPGGGGCMVLMGNDGRIFHGPGNKRGEIYVSQSESRARVANYAGGVSMVLNDTTSFVLTEQDLLAIPTKEGGAQWKRPTGANLELIMAGDYLFVGGRDHVEAMRAADGEAVWRAPVKGRAYGLAASDGKLIVSTDDGNLYCFEPKASAAPPKDVSPTVDAANAAKPNQPASRFRPALGPYLRFVDVSTAVVRWQTAEAMPSVLRLIDAGRPTEISDPTPKKKHELRIEGLRKDVLYHYQLVARSGETEEVSPDYECDMFFNVALPEGSDATDSEAARLAHEILELTDIKAGLCVDLGCDDGRLAEALVAQSSLRVLGFDTDADQVAAARKRLQAAGLYGTRVVIHHVPSLDLECAPEQFADLVVSCRLLEEPRLATRPSFVKRLLRPEGQAIFSDKPSTSREAFAGLFAYSEDLSDDNLTQANQWWILTREPSEDTGVWTHQYGTEDNSGYGGEALGGASSADELRVQWFGRPGPRAQADRSGRKPSPLSAGGRLFHQGLNRITALNAYNGVILWALEIPNLERFNVPRDSANWCADDSHVYAVVQNHCWKIRASDGVVDEFLRVLPGPRQDWKYDWGFVGRTEDVLLGSAVKADSRHSNFWGGGGWYDDKFGPATFKICSDRLFALDAATGAERWSYQRGIIINSTITASSGKVYFVESRHPKTLATDSHRVGLPELWLGQFLVALDARTGSKIWEKSIDTAEGNVIFHMAAGGGRLVILASDYRYNVYAFDQVDGHALWTQQFDWQSDNHGGHMSRPAIVGQRVFVRPRVLDLETGEILKETMPGGGCGSYAATDKSLIFRAGNVTMWDMEDCSTTNWHRLRPDCWISTIPAAGLLLSPEGGGGCSCGSWLETSIAFAPDRYPPPKVLPTTTGFIDSMKVELTARGSGGTVRYTLDGNVPTRESPVYEKPIEIRGNTLVKAATFWPADVDGRAPESSVAAVQFTRDYLPPVSSPKSIPFIDQLDVALMLPGKQGVIRYTVDGSDPTEDSPQYQKPLKLAATTTLKAIVDYEDGTLSPVMTSEYSKVDARLRPAARVEAPLPGLICHSHEGNWQSLPDFTSLKPKKTTIVEAITLKPRTANDAFGLRFEGFIKIPTDGVYSFFLKSDDGSRLWIGDQKVVDNDGMHAVVEKSGWIALEAGLHPIAIDFWDAIWGEQLEVLYEGPNLSRQPLPADVLFHATKATKTAASE